MTNNYFNSKIKLVLSVQVLFILVHVFSISSGLSYYEEGGDTFIKNTLSGVFLNQPALPPFSFGAHFVLSFFYLWLYKISPSFSWYDIFTVLYSSLAVTLLFLSLKKVVKGASIYIIASLSFLLYLDNILMLEITRISMFIAICSAFLLLSSSDNEPKWKLILLQIILTLSVFLRIESFFLSAFLMLSIFIINITYLRNLKYLLPSFFIALVLSVLLNINWTERDRQYNELRPFQFVLLDFETIKNKPYENIEDSMTMEVSKSFFLNDVKNINTDFYNKYLFPQDRNIFHLKNFLEKTDFSRAALEKKLARTSLRYYIWLLLACVFILSSKNKSKQKKGLVTTFFYVFVLFALLLFLKMENRVLFPSLVGLLLLIMLNNDVQYKKQWLFLICSIFILLPDKKYKELKQRCGEVELVYEKMQSLPKNTIVFFDMHLSVWQGRKPFQKPFSEIKVYSFDNALLFTTNEYKETMNKFFKTNDTHKILTKCVDNPNVIFFGDLQRASLLNEYFKLMYEFNADIFIFETMNPQVSAYYLKSK